MNKQAQVQAALLLQPEMQKEALLGRAVVGGAKLLGRGGRSVLAPMLGTERYARLLGRRGALRTPFQRIWNTDIVRPYTSLFSHGAQLRRAGLERRLAGLTPGTHDYNRLSKSLDRLNRADSAATKAWVRADQKSKSLDRKKEFYKSTRSNFFDPQRLGSGRFIGPGLAWVGMDSALPDTPAGRATSYAMMGPVFGGGLAASQLLTPKPPTPRIPSSTKALY